MNFLTEEHIRARHVHAGGSLVLQAGERLTPSATEYAMQQRITVSYAGACGSVAGGEAAQNGSAHNDALQCGSAQNDSLRCGASMESTLLEKGVEVPKNHPSIVMRGKLDTLLAHVVLVQTQFDPKDRKPPFLKQCLEDLYAWVMLTLKGEVTGETVMPAGMGGMDVATLHVVSREPKKYLGIDHMAAHASMGGNVALLNWTRALVRETELVAVNCSKNADVLCSLNRLSSAVYVLMLLTIAAEQGLDLATVRNA